MLRDVKPPLDLPPNFWWLALIALLLLILAVILVIFFWKRRPIQRKPSPEKIKSPWDKAFEALEALRKADLISQQKYKQYYSELSNIVRYYIEERSQIHAPEMTTEEFLFSLRNSGELNTNQKETLKDFLTSCDMVKFAKYLPPADEAQKSFDLAKRLVEETKKEGKE